MGACVPATADSCKVDACACCHLDTTRDSAGIPMSDWVKNLVCGGARLGSNLQSERSLGSYGVEGC